MEKRPTAPENAAGCGCGSGSTVTVVGAEARCTCTPTSPPPLKKASMGSEKSTERRTTVHVKLIPGMVSLPSCCGKTRYCRMMPVRYDFPLIRSRLVCTVEWGISCETQPLKSGLLLIITFCRLMPTALCTR